MNILFSQAFQLSPSFGLNYNYWQETDVEISLGCGGSKYEILSDIKVYPGLQLGLSGELNISNLIGIRLQPSVNYYFKKMQYDTDFSCVDIYRAQGLNTHHSVTFVTPLALRFNVLGDNQLYFLAGGFGDLSLLNFNTGKMDIDRCTFEGLDPPNPAQIILPLYTSARMNKLILVRML